MSNESAPFVLSDVVNGVGWITLNEPARLNPVDPDRTAQIVEACKVMSANDDARVVVVTGAGRGFCSGADLTSRADPNLVMGPGSGTAIDAGPGTWILPAMRQPVIAMVNGAAVGFGAELALQADIRIAAPSAKFRFPFSLLGTVTDTGAATWLLPRLVGWSNAAEILYSARLIDAEEALRIGLVNRVVGDADLRAHVTAMAEDMATRSWYALTTMKQMIFAGLDESKSAHVLRQYFAFNQRDRISDMAAYLQSVRGSASHQAEAPGPMPGPSLGVT